MAGVAEASQSVANKFYQKLNDEENFVFSSYSLVTALSMLLAGANNESKNEILQFLGIQNFLEF